MYFRETFFKGWTVAAFVAAAAIVGTLGAYFSSIVLSGSAKAVSLNQCMYSSKDMTDTSVTFYVNNTCNVQICVDSRVTERTNVNGDVVSGVLLMQARETGGVVGTFAQADSAAAWSVAIESRATDECY